MSLPERPAIVGVKRTLITSALLVLVVIAGCKGSADAGRLSKVGAASRWKLVWHDEFSGRAGSAPAKKRWRYDLGCSGWGNNELQCYTSRSRNVRLDGRGHLEIVARRESYGGRRYTSGWILTKGLFTRRYGRFEARIKIPRGRGTWPAFWMLGSDFDRLGWPGCGEIDVMEAIGREPRTVHGAIHGPGYTGAPVSFSYDLPAGALANGYHRYAVEWSRGRIAWYLDRVRYAVATAADLPAGAPWVFDHRFFLILNLAIGGAWPGPPDASTSFPAALSIDYVRVYERR